MSATAEATLREGDVLPDVTLTDHEGNAVRLADFRGRTLVLFFYPRDMGLRCRTQACAIRDNWPLFRSSDVEVFGINARDVDSHQHMVEHYGLPFPLLVDEGHELAQRFGFIRMISPVSMVLGALERSTVIVDPDGTIRAILRKVRAGAHFDMLRVQLKLGQPSQPVPESNVPVGETSGGA